MGRRPIRAAAALTTLLLVGLLGACGNGGAAEDGVRASSGPAAEEPATTSTTVAPASSATTTAKLGATTTGARATTTTARPATTTTPAAGAAALTPPAPGTYRYDTSGTTTVAGSPYPFPAVTTLVIDPASGTTQHSTRNLRDPAGNGPATEFTLDYRPQGVYLVLLRVTVGLSGYSDTEEVRPSSPVLLLATGARPGAHSDTVLPGTNGAHLTVDVTGSEPVTVAGQRVDTTVVQAAIQLAPGDITGRQVLTVNVDPKSRLWVKERSVSDASAAGGLFTLHGEYTATIQRLTP